jgi:hypothetical protein
LTGRVGLSTMNHMKKRLLIAIIPVAIMIAGPWAVPCLVPWSAINCRDQEINIKTGQARYSRYLWYIRISARVEDTVLSKVLNGKSVDVTEIVPWHMVNRFSPGLHHSPHYRFHGAFGQAREVELLFEMLEPDAQRKEQIVQDLLKLWQTTGSYHGAEPYLMALSDEVSSIFEKKHPGSFPEPNAVAAKEQDTLSDRRYQQALQFYKLIHEQPEHETYWARLMEKEREKTLSEAETQILSKLGSFGRTFQLWRRETPDAVVADEDRKEVDAIVARICRTPVLKSAYGLRDPNSWDRLTVRFYHGSRCHVEMFFYYNRDSLTGAGYANYIDLLKCQGRWEVLFIGHWIN